MLHAASLQNSTLAEDWERGRDRSLIVRVHLSCCLCSWEGGGRVNCLHLHMTHIVMYATCTHHTHTHAQVVSQRLAYTQQQVIRNVAVGSQ